MKAKLVENVFVGPDPKEKAIPYIDKLLKDKYKIWPYKKSHYPRSGKGRVLEQKMWDELPSKVNASPEFYSYSKDPDSYIVPFIDILEAVYGINTFNSNSIFGDTLNVPHTIEIVKIKATYGYRVSRRFAYLPKQKIILEWPANTTGTESDLRRIYFDYDHLKAHLK